VSENNAEGSKIVDLTSTVIMAPIVAARQEELILEDARVTWAVTHSTVMKKRKKWMFVE
jgi:hypothetical protein